jgi:hypothetical protein
MRAIDNLVHFELTVKSNIVCHPSLAPSRVIMSDPSALPGAARSPAPAVAPTQAPASTPSTATAPAAPSSTPLLPAQIQSTLQTIAHAHAASETHLAAQRQQREAYLGEQRKRDEEERRVRREEKRKEREEWVKRRDGSVGELMVLLDDYRPLVSHICSNSWG